MTKKTDPIAKGFFGAIPLQAFFDKRVTRLHLLALGMIAFHDRFSLYTKKQQPGCFVSIRVLSEKLGCNYSNLTTAIRDLLEWQYLKEFLFNHDRRQKVLRVVYDHTDGVPTGILSGEIVCPGGKVVCPPESQVVEAAERFGHKITIKEQRLKYSPKGRAFAKSEPALSRVERKLKSGTLDKREAKAALALCWRRVNQSSGEIGAKRWHQANRLLGELENYLGIPAPTRA